MSVCISIVFVYSLPLCKCHQIQQENLKPEEETLGGFSVQELYDTKSTCVFSW